MTERRIGQHVLELSHLDRPMFPDIGMSKGDVVDYYQRIAEYMLAQIENRPLTLHRFPDGIDKPGFYQQSRGDHFPDWLPALEVDHGGETGSVRHVMCDSQAALAYLANQGVIALHAWLSRRGQLHQPDQIIVDLDPPGEDFEPVRQAARQVGDAMRERGLTPFVKTTGSRGLHVIAPIRPEAEYERVRRAVRALVEALAERHDDTLTTAQRKDKRGGRLYLDIMRNAFGQTAVAPYSLRARPGAPVATPLAWDELEDRSLTARSFHAGNIFRRLGQRENPWQGMHRHAVRIGTLEKALGID